MKKDYYVMFTESDGSFALVVYNNDDDISDILGELWTLHMNDHSDLHDAVEGVMKRVSVKWKLIRSVSFFSR